MVVCRRCAAEVPEVDESLSLAQCPACGLVFELGDRGAKPRVRSGPGPIARARARVQAPDHFEIELDEPSAPKQGAGYRGTERATAGRPNGRARIRWSWERKGVGASFMGLLLVGAFFLGAGIVARKGTSGGNSTSIALAVAALLLASLGVLLLWLIVAHSFNGTTVTVADGMLRVDHGPVPWPGTRRIQASDVVQLWCEAFEYEAASPRGPDSKHTAYRLMAAVKRGEPVELLGSLEQPQDGLYLEQAIEQALGITDAPVAGELPKR